MPNSALASNISDSLDHFRIELPSWGFADTGTRFGKYIQPAAAVTIEEKISDAAEVHKLTGVCPTIALHVQWDFRQGRESALNVDSRDSAFNVNSRDSASDVAAIAQEHGIRPGSINPNFFQNQEYKFGSFGNPDPLIRAMALEHARESIAIAKHLGSRDISFWFADGSNYPGTANIRRRKKWFEELLALAHADLFTDQRMLIEYKPFEPAFYHTDIADWGMAVHLARAAGPQAKVLVDTGHHYAAQNIEQIVAWLLSENMLGGFHFNDRRYADDDLTLGSIDPYQVFRIFSEIRSFEWENGSDTINDIAYMIDQSHNLKGKIEAMIQTVMMAQELWAKASLVDHERLSAAQSVTDLIRSEACLQDAFATDVRPAIREWRESKSLPADPMQAFRESGYLERITADRAPRKASSVSTYA